MKSIKNSIIIGIMAFAMYSCSMQTERDLVLMDYVQTVEGAEVDLNMRIISSRYAGKITGRDSMRYHAKNYSELLAGDVEVDRVLAFEDRWKTRENWDNTPEWMVNILNVERIIDGIQDLWEVKQKRMLSGKKWDSIHDIGLWEDAIRDFNKYDLRRADVFVKIVRYEYQIGSRSLGTRKTVVQDYFFMADEKSIVGVASEKDHGKHYFVTVEEALELGMKPEDIGKDNLFD